MSDRGMWTSAEKINWQLDEAAVKMEAGAFRFLLASLKTRISDFEKMPPVEEEL